MTSFPVVHLLSSNMIQLPTVAKSSTSLVGDTHSAGYSSRDDRATKMSSFSMCVGANDY